MAAAASLHVAAQRQHVLRAQQRQQRARAAAEDGGGQGAARKGAQRPQRAARGREALKHGGVRAWPAWAAGLRSSAQHELALTERGGLH